MTLFPDYNIKLSELVKYVLLAKTQITARIINIYNVENSYEINLSDMFFHYVQPVNAHRSVNSW